MASQKSQSPSVSVSYLSKLVSTFELTPNLEKIDRGVQVSQNEPVKKNDTPVDAADEVKLILSLNRQVGIFI